MATSFSEENLLPQFVGKISNTCSNPAEVAQQATPIVVVEHSQLRAMSSETVDPIDWPLTPAIYRALPPERHLHSTNHHSF